MQILYDGFIYKIQAAGGINRYLANIIKRLPGDWTPVLTVDGLRQLNFPGHPQLKLKPFPLAGLRPEKIAKWGSEIFFSRIEGQKKFNLIHSVFHFSLAGRRACNRRAPFLLTVHDMLPEIFHDDIDPKGIEAGIKRRAIEEADAVVCVSENTRKDFLERNRFPEDRVFVTPLASELSREMAMGDERVPEYPYFLFVGSRAIYKNFARLVLAFAAVAQKWPDVKLCLIGTQFDATERSFFSALNIRDRVVNLGQVSDGQLAKLYRCAVALAYPSLYEGFGIPPLEALSCGGIVIAPATSSLPEVIGNICLPIEPRSVESIIEALFAARDLTTDRRQELISQGLAQSSRFSWNETVRRTTEIYQKVAA